MSTTHDNIIESLRTALAGHVGLQVPPAIFAEMGLRITEYSEGKGIVCGFPAQQKLANPWGIYQGGAMMTCFDIAFGLLAVLETQAPCTTITMESSFVRPLPADGAEFLVQARLRAKTKHIMFMEGKVRGANGKTAATASTTVAPIKPGSSPAATQQIRPISAD